MDDVKVNKVPKLRYSSFREEWRRGKLKDLIISLESGVSVNSDNKAISSENELGILKTSCITSGKFVATENKIILEEDIARARLNPVHGTIIISRMNTPQLVGESGYVDKNYPNLFIPDRLWMATVNLVDVCSKWLSILLTTEKVKAELRNIATGTSGSMKNIAKPNFLGIDVLIPNLPEQQNIATFITAVDDKIQQLSKKKALLEKYKKGLMQQIFNQEIRFKNKFGQDYQRWEEKKLEEVFMNRVEKNIADGELLSVTINYGVKRHSDMDRRDSSSNDKSTYLFVKRGDIVYNSMRMWQGASGKSLWDGIVSPAYTVLAIKEGYDADFFVYMFKLKKMIQTFQKHSQGLTSDTWNLKYSKLKKIKIEVPCLEEQTKIANFLSTIDDKINHVHKQLVQTQQYKKGLLQQMFV